MTGLWPLIRADHEQVWDLLEQLTGGPDQPGGPPPQHRRVARQLVALESAHEAAEQLVLWPEVRRRCREGSELVAEVLSQEREAKQALNELEHIAAGTIEFDECVGTVAGMARTHLSYEQTQIWPRLDDQLDDEARQALARRWLAARRRGPTRPHPHMPPAPALLRSVGMLVAGLDRVRDRLTGRPSPPALPAGAGGPGLG